MLLEKINSKFNLLTNEYRPTTLDDVVMHNRAKKFIERGLQQDIMLYGSPGIGKSTILNILTKGFDVKRWNMSNDRGISVLREEFTEFAMTQSIMSVNSRKVLWLEARKSYTRNLQLAWNKSKKER